MGQNADSSTLVIVGIHNNMSVILVFKKKKQ